MPYATSTDGIHIFYTSKGEGEPLVLSHGGTHTWESWQDLGYVDGLRDHFQLVLIDSRGHGRSDKPHDASSYALTQQADDVVAVVEALGIDRFHFWGYSQGVQIGFHLAARTPDRIQTFVAYGGHPYPTSAEDHAAVEEINTILQRGMQGWVDRMEAAGVLAHYPNPAARKERLLAADPAALIAANLGSASDSGIIDALSRLTMPCLLIAGERDSANELARQAVKGLPVADFVLVGNTGHAMVHAQSILPYVRAFHERFGFTAGASDSVGH